MTESGEFACCSFGPCRLQGLILPWLLFGHLSNCKKTMQDAEVGRALRSKPVTAVVGEGACRTLFVHAGLQPGQLTQLQLHRPMEGGKGEDLLEFLNVETLGALTKFQMHTQMAGALRGKSHLRHNLRARQWGLPIFGAELRAVSRLSWKDLAKALSDGCPCGVKIRAAIRSNSENLLKLFTAEGPRKKTWR